jgi:hypothetical protein
MQIAKFTIALLLSLSLINICYSQNGKVKLGIDQHKIDAAFEFPEELASEGRSFLLLLLLDDGIVKNNFKVLNSLDSSLANKISLTLTKAHEKIRSSIKLNGIVIPVIFLCTDGIPGNLYDVHTDFSNTRTFFQQLRMNKRPMTDFVNIIGFPKKERRNG